MQESKKTVLSLSKSNLREKKIEQQLQLSRKKLCFFCVQREIKKWTEMLKFSYKKKARWLCWIIWIVVFRVGEFSAISTCDDERRRHHTKSKNCVCAREEEWKDATSHRKEIYPKSVKIVLVLFRDLYTFPVFCSNYSSTTANEDDDGEIYMRVREKSETPSLCARGEERSSQV